ncbi:hypothetical protein [Cellulomonas sp. URHE0023]|uniref:hypothetical protein n=1 Tax=Cellulomonas sp. URHE0023 TaxID=1380354 RepID=UPI00047F322C|nr:hypothetical protein [Cellulomonas sp. URHE0023]
MGELVRIGYTRVLDVRVLHHFWLDEGPTDFDRISDPVKKDARLLTYDVRRLLSFVPSVATSATISGLRGFFRTTGLGFLVAVPDDATLAIDSTFEFFVAVVAPDYASYTAQPLARPGITDPTARSLSPQPTVTVIEPPTDPVTGSQRVHRYKANVPVLSNTTGVARGSGEAERLYLSTDYPSAAAADPVEALVVVGDDLGQRVGDPPDAPINVLGARTDFPIFVHQGDVPAISPPPGSSGAPAFGIELTADAPPDVCAVIRLVPVRSAGSPFNFADQDGTPRPRVFEVHLQNRRTTWRYFRRSDGQPIPTATEPLPLTHFGNAGTKQKPSSAAVTAELDNQNPSRITRYVSDIFV